jgi:hypothetical protein
VKIKSQKNFFSGLLFMVVGVAFAWGATSYDVGTAAQMGPGYFPLVLGALMAILGIVLAMTALVVETETGDPVGRWAWRPLFLVLLSNVAFGALLGGLPLVGLQPMGLVVAIVATVLIASLASRAFKLRDALLLAIVLAAGSYIAFIWVLQWQIPAWPAFVSV